VVVVVVVVVVVRSCLRHCSRSPNRTHARLVSRTDVLCTSLPGMIWRGALRCLSTLQGPTCTTTRRSFTRRRSLLHRTRRGVGTTTLKCTPTGGGSHVRLPAHPLLLSAHLCSLSVLHHRHPLSTLFTARPPPPHPPTHHACPQPFLHHDVITQALNTHSTRTHIAGISLTTYSWVEPCLLLVVQRYGACRVCLFGCFDAALPKARAKVFQGVG
jgi:hypothetical protein